MEAMDGTVHDAISLGELESALAAMTKCGLDGEEEKKVANLRGMFAALDAAPGLVSVAKAALEWKRTLGDDVDYKLQDSACEALDAVLTKVRP